MEGRKAVLLWCLGVGVLGFFSVKVGARAAASQPLISRKTEVLKDGREVTLWTVSNAKLAVSLSSLGAAITSLKAPSSLTPNPSASDETSDVVLSYPSQEAALQSGAYMGVIVGRVANRIKNGLVTIDGKEFSVPCNDGGVNSLHGGDVGFSRCVWTAQALDSGDGVQFRLESPDGDQGYPHTVKAKATYRLKGSTIELEMEATSDGPTPVNLAQHSYFNLAGHSSGSVLGHKVQLNAESYTPVENLIPTEEVVSCGGSAYDFTRPAVVGQKIAELAMDRQLPLQYDVSRKIIVDTLTKEKLAPESRGGAKSGSPIGFDTNFVVSRRQGPGGKVLQALKKLMFWRKIQPQTFLVAKVSEDSTGRTLTVRSTAPGVQFYTGNFLCEEIGKAGNNYDQFGGFCLETQHYPNSVAADPATEFGAGATPIISPGNPYYHKVTYSFGVE